MTELHAHPVPAETTIVDDSRTLLRSIVYFYDRNRVVLAVTGVIAVSLLVNRAMMRRELRHLNFAIDIYPDGSVGEDGWMGE